MGKIGKNEIRKKKKKCRRTETNKRDAEQQRFAIRAFVKFISPPGDVMAHFHKCTLFADNLTAPTECHEITDTHPIYGYAYAKNLCVPNVLSVEREKYIYIYIYTIQNLK